MQNVSPHQVKTEEALWLGVWGLVQEEASEMALTRGSFVGYEFDRMVVLFSMVEGQRNVPCAISTSAMDDLDKPERASADQREAQFMRLRDRIEEQAARKFVAQEFEGTPPGIILRSIDFRLSPG
jgi:uncharacterized protein DUF1488